MLNDITTTIHRLVLAGVFVDFKPRFSDTLKFFEKYMAGSENIANEQPLPLVEVSDPAYKDWKEAGNSIDGFAEFCLLCQAMSERLFEDDRCVFHAAALRYNEQAFLLAGGSGAGKSTHCKQLLLDHSDEFSVINGDKPILQWTEEGVIVHPSPWNGKEGLKGAGAAKLAGIFLIRRSSENSVLTCDDKEAAIFSFPLVFQSYLNEGIIKKTASLTEKIVKSSPCFIFNSKDIKESSDLLYHTLKEMFQKEET